MIRNHHHWGLVRMLFLLLPVQAVSAQQPVRTDTARLPAGVPQQIRGTSQAEVVERIRQSGLSRSEMRARLQRAGYNPGLADRYYDVLERGGEPPRGEASQDMLTALSTLGISTPATLGMRIDSITGDTIFIDPQAQRDSMFAADSAAAVGIQVFGLRTFRRAATQFTPVLSGPIDRGYRLGPGDELLLVLSGDVEAAYSLNVTRDGSIFVPDVGQISVAGLTLEGLEDVLYTRLGRVYSGISRSPDATTRFQITVGQLRTNQVFVRGEVTSPNAYQISSVGTVMTALYHAGGPTANGSFRHVEVHRGGRVAHVIDLYEFLVGGSLASDVRLEHNDHIFVPPVGPQVRIEGSVRRPAIYEIRPGEGLRHLLLFAGGLRSDALVRRIQIDRILPPDQQRPGYYRTLVDANLAELNAEGAGIPLFDGDVVTVFTVNDERRNRVVLQGEVRNPGLYEWRPGVTLWDVLDRADGLGERAYTSRAHIYRLVQTDGSRRLIPVTLERDAQGRPRTNLTLSDNDSIVVLSREELRTPETVSIDGFVKYPDTYDLARGMTLKDLVLAAGGFIEGAYVLEAELSRLTNPLIRSDTTAVVSRLPLGPPTEARTGDDAIPVWVPSSGEVQLQHGDRVFIRRAPGYEESRAVTVVGEVMVPGTYVLTTRDEKLSDVIARAGGLTPQAYREGLRVVRDGRVVAGDLARALRNARDRNNIVLVEGDSIQVPTLDPTVVVTGAVQFEARVLYVPGRDVDYYIRQAGGFTEAAEEDQVTISYANGERTTARGGWFRREPDVQPGSRIFVPAQPPDLVGTNWDQILSRTAGILGAVTTIILAIGQIRN